MLAIDLTGKRALVAGVSDDGGFGFAIAKALAEAGADRSAWAAGRRRSASSPSCSSAGRWTSPCGCPTGGKLEFERIYPLDAAFDTLAEVPAEMRENKRYKEQGDFSMQGMAERLRQDFGDQALDIVVHSLANAPEVKSPLVDTSRQGYLAAVERERVQQRRPGAAPRAADAAGRGVPLADLHGGRAGDSRLRRRHVVGQGGARGRHPDAGLRGGPALGRAGQRDLGRALGLARGPAIGFIDTMIKYAAANSPLPRPIDAADVGHTAAFLCSPLARAITGSVVYVDNGFHAMGMAVPEAGA